jgi:hypothetical protein
MNVAALAQLLHETAKHHGSFEAVARPRAGATRLLAARDGDGELEQHSGDGGVDPGGVQEGPGTAR